MFGGPFRILHSRRFFYLRILAALAFVYIHTPAYGASVPKWEIFEVTLKTSEKLANPFWDVSLSAVFRNKHRQATMEGFYDGQEGGQHVFRIRFAPDDVGPWTYIVASSLPAFNGKTGEFEVTSPVTPGGLIRKPGFPRAFFRADGNRYYPINIGLFPHPNSKGGSDFAITAAWRFPSKRDMIAYIDLLGRNGVNMFMDIRVLFQRLPEISDPSFYPPFEVIDPNTWKIDRDRFSLTYFQRLDRELARAKQHGLFYILQILTSQAVQQTEGTWARSFYNAANGGWLQDRDGDGNGINEYFNLEDPENVRYIEATLRYTLARTSAYWNVMYRIGGDTRNRRGEGVALEPDAAVRWFRRWYRFVRAKDPHGRPLMIGRAQEAVMTRVGSDWNAIPDWSNQDVTACGGPAIDWGRSDQATIMRAIRARGQCFRMDPDYQRPVTLYETPGPPWKRNDLYEMERRAYWVALASGWSLARPDAHFPVMTGDPPRLYEMVFRQLEGDVPPTLLALRRMSEFLAQAGLEMERMAPYPGLVPDNEDVYVLAYPGHTYLAVLPFGGMATIRLRERVEYEAQFFNPRDGSYQAKMAVKGGVQQFTAPTPEDWVLLLRKKE